MTAGWLRFHRRAGRAAVTATILLWFAAPAQAIRIGASQFEAVDWPKLEGWADDDHLAAFATFMQSCRAILRSGGDARGRPIFRGLHEACTVAATADAEGRERGARLLRAELPPGPHHAERRDRGIPDRLLRADRRWLARAERRIRPSAVPHARWIAARRQAAQGRQLRPQQGRLEDRQGRESDQEGGAVRREEGRRQGAPRRPAAGFVLRPRRDRGRRAQGPQSRDRLSQGSGRLVLHPDPGFGARASARRHLDARQLRVAERPSVLCGRQMADRQENLHQGRNVDGPHPAMDDGQSERGRRAPPDEQVVCVLPRDRSCRRHRAGRCAGRVAYRRAAR